MLKAPIGKNERERLAELLRLDVLDSDPESVFDEMTRLAAEICGTRIALISLVDESRQWFKSSHGLDAKETPREVSFCGHAIQGDTVFEVPDARVDERFADNPLVTGAPNVTFYAGAPLAVGDFKIGTLCAIDFIPKKLTDHQRWALESLARQAVLVLEYRLKTLKIKELYETVERQRLESEKSAKMAALGEMAGGIAHEINNPLAIITGYIQRLKTSLQAPDTKTSEYIATIEKTALRITKIVKGLRQFSRSADDDPTARTQVKEIVDDTLVLCSERLKYELKFIYAGCAGDLYLDCRGTEISQVLMNLLTNAADAAMTTEEKWVKLEVTKVNAYVLIEVTDSGKGIPMSVQDKMLQPFFTTKAVGRGTGLGLSISKGIIEKHGGALSYSDSGGNTKFTMRLGAA